MALIKVESMIYVQLMCKVRPYDLVSQTLYMLTVSASANSNVSISRHYQSQHEDQRQRLVM